MQYYAPTVPAQTYYYPSNGAAVPTVSYHPSTVAYSPQPPTQYVSTQYGEAPTVSYSCYSPSIGFTNGGVAPVARPPAMTGPVVSAQYVTPTREALKMRSEVWTMHHDIVDSGNRAVFRVHQKHTSFSNRTVLEDLQGKEILQTHDQQTVTDWRSFIETPDRRQLAEVCLDRSAGGTPILTVRTHNGQVFEVHSDRNAGKAVRIVNKATGYAVAAVSRSFKGTQVGFGSDQSTYLMKMEAGVDMAFMAGLLLCMDTMQWIRDHRLEQRF